MSLEKNNMEKIEIIGNTELAFEADDMSYVISALLDMKTNKYSMPSLAFTKEYGMIYEKYEAIWDNDTYLIDTLYDKVLLPWVVDKTIPSPEEFAALLKIDGVKLEDFEGIYELFNKAIELKFFEK